MRLPNNEGDNTIDSNHATETKLEAARETLATMATAEAKRNAEALIPKFQFERILNQGGFKVKLHYEAKKTPL